MLSFAAMASSFTRQDHGFNDNEIMNLDSVLGRYAIWFWADCFERVFRCVEILCGQRIQGGMDWVHLARGRVTGNAGEERLVESRNILDPGEGGAPLPSWEQHPLQALESSMQADAAKLFQFTLPEGKRAPGYEFINIDDIVGHITSAHSRVLRAGSGALQVLKTRTLTREMGWQARRAVYLLEIYRSCGERGLLLLAEGRPPHPEMEGESFEFELDELEFDRHMAH